MKETLMFIRRRESVRESKMTWLSARSDIQGQSSRALRRTADRHGSIFQKCLRLCLLLVGAVVLLTRPAQAVDIDEELWGFDGRVLIQEFNLLSIRVSNPTDTPYEGLLELRRRDNTGQTIGATMVEPLYVSPFSTRWVQFYPYVSNLRETWSVRATGEASVKIQQSRSGKKLPVLLVPADSVSSSGGGIRRFSEENFPPTVTATKALDALFMNRMPRWESPRRQAFIDWVRLGGIVHLLQQDDGEWPKFTDELAPLNDPLDVNRVGRGLVIKHDYAVDALDKTKVEQAVAAAQRVLHPGKDELDAAMETKRGAQANAQQNAWGNDFGLYDVLDESFTTLRELTRPNHNWLLIYFLSFVYIACVFPGCFLLGRRKLHYALTYGAILGTALLFSTIFLIVGKRGYGEETSVNSVAVATPIGDGAWDVLQWSNVFVTDGDDYTISHKGKGQLYSTCESREPVNGVIDNGVDGSFQVDIPPFSNRTFASRTKVVLKDINLNVTDLKTNGRNLSKLVIQTDGTFPRNVVYQFVQYGSKFYSMSSGSNTMQSVGTGQEMSRFLNLAAFNSFYGVRSFNYEEKTAKDLQQKFENLWKPLLAWNLGVIQDRPRHDISVPADRARVFIVAEMPDNLFIGGDQFSQQTGYVLYSIDVTGNSTP